MADLYRLLGLNRTASQSEIKSAYRRLARKYHPDVNPDPAAARKFVRLTEAYHVLSDPQRRSLYDLNGATEVCGAGPSRSANYARAVRRAYYQARADRAVNEWLARERAETRERGHAVFTTITLFLSTFAVGLFKPGILEATNPFWYVVMVIVFAASLWYLALSLKRHFDRYTYRQELTSLLHETRAKKPYSRGVAWTFIVGGYLISLGLGFLVGAEQVNEREILDGVLSALFYPPIAVFILDVMYLMNVRLKQW